MTIDDARDIDEIADKLRLRRHRVEVYYRDQVIVVDYQVQITFERVRREGAAGVEAML